MKNRKGSALVLTLIIFAVLIILGTAILGFMVNENKMSLYHQHKTQAYYIARAGAVTVEAAVLKAYDIDEGKTLDKNVKETEENIDIEGLDAKATIKKIKDGAKVGDTQKYLYIIKSEGNSNNVKELVEKVIPIEITETIKKVVKIESPITYIESQDKAFESKKGKQGEKKDFPDYEFAESFDLIGTYTETTTIPGNAGNFLVKDSLMLENKNFEINGEVNIYVRNRISLRNVNINYKNNASKLNIYIYGENNLTADSLELTGGSGANIKMQANFFVKQGGIKIDYHKLDFTGNIVTNGESVKIVSHSNNMDHVKINGMIYAPNGTIQIGELSEDKGALKITGAIVGKILKYTPKNNNDADGKKFDITGDLGGITSPFEDEVTITVKKSSGYFK